MWPDVRVPDAGKPDPRVSRVRWDTTREGPVDVCSECGVPARSRDWRAARGVWGLVRAPWRSRFVPVGELGPARMAFYITTAIDYVNSRPHLGTAYEKITADIIARYKRLAGVPTWFVMGNDEHSLNVLRRAKEQGLDP